MSSRYDGDRAAVAPPAVLLASGHMLDEPDRATPRFPLSQLARVTAEVADTLETWGVGPMTTVITGGAQGADLIIAEQAAARGARIVVCLAMAPAAFEERSVARAGSDWSHRFRWLLDRAEVRVLSDARRSARGDVFARTNRWMVDVATTLAEQPHVLLVWDGRQSDGPGGTRDMVARLGITRPNDRVRVIDPTPRAYEARQRFDRPKRMLALDGGGMRGVISLEILKTIEKGLRIRLGREDLVLADYFDYIAGTSTGAIIAAALAIGQPVDEICDRYERLGRRVFAKRWLLARMRSLYKDAPLRRELHELLGPGRTLGDPAIRTLLLVVMHNTVTDSPWPLSNCTQAKYNRADRALAEVSDRNLDIPLTPLIRASTAAPVYFEPEELTVGTHKFVFQDGGVTPFNNPALLQFLMATLPEYKLEWPVGEEHLLVVSVGTGSSAAVHPGLRRRTVKLPFNARNLPSVFMNGASVSQDLLCRSMARCRNGRPIDREFGARLYAQGVAGANLFTYVRYDADLSDNALKVLGIKRKKHRERVRKLDAVDQLPTLKRIGRHAASAVDLEAHFAGFVAT